MLRAALALLLLIFPASAEPILIRPADELRVIDGDTFALGSRRYRFPDVEAPPIRPEKNNPGCPAAFAAGRQAKAALETLLEGREVMMDLTGKECGWGRPCARLFVGDDDVIARLLAAGHLRRWRHRNGRALEPRPSWCAAVRLSDSDARSDSRTVSA